MASDGMSITNKEVDNVKMSISVEQMNNDEMSSGVFDKMPRDVFAFSSLQPGGK
jgi:hypothetical protein